MVISPKQARELSQLDRLIVSRLENEIDKLLDENFTDEKLIQRYKLPDDIKAKVLKELKRMYDEAGWEVTCEYITAYGQQLRLRPK